MISIMRLVGSFKVAMLAFVFVGALQSCTRAKVISFAGCEIPVPEVAEAKNIGGRLQYLNPNLDLGWGRIYYSNEYSASVLAEQSIGARNIVLLDRGRLNAFEYYRFEFSEIKEVPVYALTRPGYEGAVWFYGDLNVLETWHIRCE